MDEEGYVRITGRIKWVVVRWSMGLVLISFAPLRLLFVSSPILFRHVAIHAFSLFAIVF